MPLEVDIEKDIKPTKRLRPEYIRTLEKPLNSDAFLSEVNT